MHINFVSVPSKELDTESIAIHKPDNLVPAIGDTLILQFCPIGDTGRGRIRDKGMVPAESKEHLFHGQSVVQVLCDQVKQNSFREGRGIAPVRCCSCFVSFVLAFARKTIHVPTKFGNLRHRVQSIVELWPHACIRVSFSEACHMPLLLCQQSRGSLYISLCLS